MRFIWWVYYFILKPIEFRKILVHETKSSFRVNLFHPFIYIWLQRLTRWRRTEVRLQAKLPASSKRALTIPVSRWNWVDLYDFLYNQMRVTSQDRTASQLLFCHLAVATHPRAKYLSWEYWLTRQHLAPLWPMRLYIDCHRVTRDAKLTLITLQTIHMR